MNPIYAKIVDALLSKISAREVLIHLLRFYCFDSELDHTIILRASHFLSRHLDDEELQEVMDEVKNS